MVLPNIKFTRPLTSANVVTLVALASFFFSVLYYALSPSPLLPFDTLSAPSPEPNKPNGTPREAYVTFLSNEDPYYFASARLLVFALQHDPLTADPSRPVIVLTTPSVPASYSRKLEAEGAIVIEKPPITSLPMVQTNPRWKDVYTKLWIFNLTSYDRLVYYDADHLVLRPVDSIWEAENSWPEGGLAALGSGDGGYVEDSDYFLAGFFIAIPKGEIMEGLLAEKDYDPVFPEQNLMNKYFSRDGPRPWAPLDPIHESISPKYEHVEQGAHTIHEKCWQGWVERRLAELFHERLGRMEGYWLAKELNGTIPTSDPYG
ncbi:hypothetical protein I307_01559 [Cryptococcus deuterogattii 99/473]|uniref:Glycosyltransferase family 8 protein n=1 Tax=Cryptococcus deuterogattii Ram5 TaxID=1296110 RepID=A0A0D0UXG5_9TREE|nr:hypothetical protein I313_04994 [Cryptococcus deuterogattii Ram5]KIY58766.1 hypothetical protein I307_01559 [Cryptococcus deuterogattii 99/473]